MSHESEFEYYEVPSFGNIKFVFDSNGNGWFCPGDASNDGDFFSQGCERAESIVYDRGFGG